MTPKVKRKKICFKHLDAPTCLCEIPDAALGAMLKELRSMKDRAERVKRKKEHKS